MCVCVCVCVCACVCAYVQAKTAGFDSTTSLGFQIMDVLHVRNSSWRPNERDNVSLFTTCFVSLSHGHINTSTKTDGSSLSLLVCE